MGVLHIVVKKGVGGMLGVSLYIKGGYILGGGGGEILGGSHIDLRCLKGGVYSGREGYNLGGLHVDV